MRYATLALLLTLLSPALSAQNFNAQKPSPLSDYQGTYTDSPGHTLEIVAGDQLFAVQDGAKYKIGRAHV